MNKKKILQLILTSTTVAGGMTLTNTKAEAIEVNQNIKNDKESIITFNDSYEGKVVNVNTNLRVRADASKESKVIGYLSDGEICEIKAETVEWYRINFNGNEGYVDKEYIEPINKSRSTISVKKGQVVGTDDGLIVRQAANIYSANIGLLKDGDLVEIISKSGEWYNIKIGSTLGFVYEKYIKVFEEEIIKPNNSTVMGRVNDISSNLRIRSEANNDSAIVGYLLSREEVEILEEEKDWYKINYNEKIGYVSKEYITKLSDDELNELNDLVDKESDSYVNVSNDEINKESDSGLDETNDMINKESDSDSDVLNDAVDEDTDSELVLPSGESDKDLNNESEVVNDTIAEEKNDSTINNNEDLDITEEYISRVAPIRERSITGKGTVINANEGLRVRLSASINSIIIGHVYTGNELDIIGLDGEWYKIKFNNTTGYVHKDYVNFIEAESNITGEGTVVNANEGLRVRKAASTNSEVLGHVYTGNKLEIIGLSGDWYKIKFNNGTGYVHKDYINISESSGSGSGNDGSLGESSITGKGTVINADEGLRVRESASTSASILGHVYTGNKLAIIGSSGDWYKVNFNNTTGYVHKDYIKISESGSNNNETENITQKGEVYNTGSNLRVRESASTSSVVLGYLTDGEKVDIIGSDGAWYKINYKDKVGYVSKEYVKLISNTENTNPNKPNGSGSNENYENIISMGSVATSTLNVRSGAGTEFETIGSLTLNTIVKIVDTSSNGWHKIKYNKGFGYISSDYIKISTNLSNYAMELDQYVDMQYPKLNMTDKGGEWRNATKEEIKYNLDSMNFIEDSGKYMFMKLNYIDGFSLDLVNEVIEGRGILSGKGQAFLDGARKYNVNVMYLLTHARLETGNGTSNLSTGVLVTEVDGQPVEPRVVYNMYGVGAIDSDPLRGGAEYAYKQGWFTPEIAIAEGASWISRNYINNETHGQNTLYKMRWDISSSGVSWHQYASDIAWAEKQARIMAPYLERCGVALEFDIPTFGRGK